jgi:hypothetical protein
MYLWRSQVFTRPCVVKILLQIIRYRDKPCLPKLGISFYFSSVHCDFSHSIKQNDLEPAVMAACVETHSIPAEWIPHLDPEWVSLWNNHGRHQYRADEVSVPEYRKNPKAYSFTYAAWTGPKVFHEEEFDVPVTKPSGTVRVRVYTPEGEGPFPVHINYHGGGWVLGGLESEAAWCRSICNNVNIKVIDVDYRMAPEFLFPTAIYDSWEVVQWV